MINFYKIIQRIRQKGNIFRNFVTPNTLPKKMNITGPLNVNIILPASSPIGRLGCSKSIRESTNSNFQSWKALTNMILQERSPYLLTTPYKNEWKHPYPYHNNLELCLWRILWSSKCSYPCKLWTKQIERICCFILCLALYEWTRIVIALISFH